MRRLMVVLKWGGLGLLLLIGSWVAFNGPWADTLARPRPAALTPAPLQVGEPSAYAMLWSEKTHVDLPQAPPWQCGAQGGNCAQVWLEQSDKLREQLKSAGAFAEVCEATSGEGVSWVEPALKIPETNPASFAIPQFKNITACHRWLRAQAVLAVLDGNDAKALQFLQRADRVMRGALVGAQSLIGHAVAWSLARQQWQTLVALAGNRPQLAGQFQEFVRPLDPAALGTERWIATESTFSQALMRDLPRSCDAMRGAPEEVHGWLDRFWCRSKLGFLPELSTQDMDAVFLQMAERTHDGAVQAAAHRPAPAPETSPWAWRNSVGHVLVAVAKPNWLPYIDKQAEVELGRQAAELALKMTAEHVPAAQREAWLQAQRLPAETQGHFSLTADHQLRAQPWRTDEDAARQLTFPLPGSA